MINKEDHGKGFSLLLPWRFAQSVWFTAEDALTLAHASAPFRLGKPLLDAEYSPEGKGMPFSARSEWSSPSMSQKWNSVLERI
ncbi:MAG: hypothetical protein H6Q48_4011 [Deltaproteobacteria bacterium]|nr:hypothetical protein [Deltaproteobacteria bacterium]